MKTKEEEEKYTIKSILEQKENNRRKVNSCRAVLTLRSFFFVGDTLPFEFELVRFRGRNPRVAIGDETFNWISSLHPESLDDALAGFDSDDEYSSSLLNSLRKLSNRCLPLITKSSHL